MGIRLVKMKFIAEFLSYPVVLLVILNLEVVHALEVLESSPTYLDPCELERNWEPWRTHPNSVRDHLTLAVHHGHHSGPAATKDQVGFLFVKLACQGTRMGFGRDSRHLFGLGEGGEECLWQEQCLWSPIFLFVHGLKIACWPEPWGMVTRYRELKGSCIILFCHSRNCWA